MRIRFAVLLALLVIAALINYAVRQRTLNELRAGNATLRRQLEEQTTAASSQAAGASLTNAVVELSDAERNELLRLRGQILSLRNEAAQASSRVAELNRPGADRNPAGKSQQP
jgi:hypothetical protein